MSVLSFLFPRLMDSPKGAAASAAIYSLVETISKAKLEFAGHYLPPEH
ncbi:hypothetical protein SPX_11700 [Sporomusa paucivorans]|uniref:Uncharacterized protein n=1 Tax=Sporomusa sphaeroides DSM 2875 TaxID=1337886 RepID=A0ABM9W6A7_9FIRM|nr:hypothetical protein SPSPH_11400 [Sporomusa sphaeroides DSM 2875]CVK20680.1 hypothetical protein SSPH_03348 [Sporomusa sphaeroides DSM 2875]